MTLVAKLNSTTLAFGAALVACPIGASPAKILKGKFVVRKLPPVAAIEVAPLTLSLIHI